MCKRDNIFSWLSGFTLSGTAIINGWIQVETAIEVAVYGFIGGVVGMLGKCEDVSLSVIAPKAWTVS